MTETVNVELCERCAFELRTLHDAKGETAMIEAAARVLRACPSCSAQLPLELRAGPFVTTPIVLS